MNGHIEKRNSMIDGLLRFWPLIILVGSFVIGTVVLKYQVEAKDREQDKINTAVETKINKLETTSQQQAESFNQILIKLSELKVDMEWIKKNK